MPSKACFVVFALVVIGPAVAQNTAPELPILLSQPLSDATTAASHSDSAELARIRKMYVDSEIKFNDVEVQGLIDNLRETQLANNSLKVVDDATRWAFKNTVEDEIKRSDDPNSPLRPFMKFLQQGAEKALDIYFEKEEKARDALLANNYRQDLASIPKSSGVPTSTEVRAFYLQHRERLLGSNVLLALRSQGAAQNVIDETQDEFLTRLLELQAKHGADLRKLEARQNITDQQFASMLVNQNKIKHDLNNIAAKQNSLIELGEGLKRDVSQIQSSVELTQEKVSVVYDVLFAQLPPSEQKRYLQSQLDALPNTERDKAINALDTRIALEETIPAALDHLREIGSILNSLGVPKDVVQNFNTAVDMASKFQRGALAFGQMNYLGGVAAVLSIFDASGDDVEGKRFIAVLQRLDQIRELQIKTLQLLQSIAQEIATVVERLDLLAENLDEVKDLTRENLESTIGFNDCQLMSSSLKEKQYTDGSGRFVGFQQRQRHFQEFSSGTKSTYFANCLRSFDVLFGDADLSSLFHERAQSGTELLPNRRYKTALTALVENIPTIKSIADPAERNDRVNRLFALSIEPVPLNRTPKLIADIEQENVSYDRFLPQTKYELLSPSAIHRYVTQLLRYNDYPLFIKRAGVIRRLFGTDFVLIDPNDLARTGLTEEQKKAANDNKRRLQRALRIINTAIAQQHLLTGSLTMIAISNRLLDYSIPNSVLEFPAGDTNAANLRASEQQKYFQQNVNVIRFISRNQTFAANWAKFLILTAIYPDIWQQSKPFQSTNYLSFSGNIVTDVKQTPSFRAKEKRALLIALDNALCPELVKLNNTPHPMGGGMSSAGCFRTAQASWDERYNNSKPDPEIFRLNTAKLTAEMLTENGLSRVPVPLPNFEDIDPSDVNLNVPVQSAELKLLYRTKAEVLNALMQYTQFEGLSPKQRAVLVQLQVRP